MRKWFNYLLGFFVFFSAIYYIPGQNFHDSQMLLFKTGVLILFAVSLCFKPVRCIINIWVNSFLLLSIASLYFNADSRGVQIEPMVNVVLVIMLFYILLNHFEDTNLIYGGIIAVILINFVMVLTQVFKIDPLCLDDTARQNTHLVGLFGHPMNLGSYMAVILPYIFYKNKWFFGLALFLLFASKSFAAIGCGVFGLLLYIWFNNKRIGTIAAIFVVIIGLVAGGMNYLRLSPDKKDMITDKITLRISTQYPLVKAALGRPWLGCGLGTFKYIVPQVLEKEATLKTLGELDVTWNDYLGCALEIGLFVLFIFFGFFRDVFRKFYHAPKSQELNAIFASLTTIPLGIFFHSYMNYINIGILCISMYCLFEIKLQKEVVPCG